MILHRVLAVPDPLFPLEIDARHFDELCRWTKALFNVLPLDDATRRLREGTLPERSLAITFDDGYTDNHDVALPILARHGLQATFFIATGFLDGGRMWNDIVVESIRRSMLPTLDLQDLAQVELGSYDLGSMQQRSEAILSVRSALMHLAPEIRAELAERVAEKASVAVPTNLMMTTSQVRALHDEGMQIGAHTVTHPILSVLSPAAMSREMSQSKQALEAIVDQRIGLFAYPSGFPRRDFNAASVRAARDAGFDMAVTTAWGAAGPSNDIFQLPRFTPWDRTRNSFSLRMLSNLWFSRGGRLRTGSHVPPEL